MGVKREFNGLSVVYEHLDAVPIGGVDAHLTIGCMKSIVAILKSVLHLIQ